MRNNLFTGPIFIIGMPRSGTKLLRDILNQNQRIGIPDIETNILPLWVKNWNRYGDLSKLSLFYKFYRKMIRKSYFQYMNESNRLIDCLTWFNLCENFTPAGVFEALIRHDADVSYHSLKIWGDKSPSYIRHVPLLKNLFPNARIIHIIRDVRDYCLSINNAWGKNIIRAAQRWNDDVSKIKSDSIIFQTHFIEIRYEDLISQPVSTLKQICNFLDVKFDSKMLTLPKPSENLGDAKGIKGIKSDNANKFLYKMRPKTLKKIEAIASSALRANNYYVNYSGKGKRISKFEMYYYQILDGIIILTQEVQKKIINIQHGDIKKFFIADNR